MEDIQIPVCVQTDGFHNTSVQEAPMDVLPDNLEELVKLRLPYSTISYLALVTDYNFLHGWTVQPSS